MSQVSVIIHVLDTNDNRPVFTGSSYNATIPENVPIGSMVLTVQALDVDIGDNAVFQYRVLGGDDTFEISEDGVIVTKAALDFENKTLYIFLVSVNVKPVL